MKHTNLICYYGNITITNCSMEYVKCEFIRNGYINKLSSNVDIKIVGGGTGRALPTGTVYIDKNTVVENEDIYGIGKVILKE